MLSLLGQLVPDGDVFDLPYRTLDLDELVSAPGSLRVTVDAEPDSAWSRVALGETFVYVVDDDGTIEWAGIIWSDDWADGALTVQAEGLFSYFRSTAGRDRVYRGGITGMSVGSATANGGVEWTAAEQFDIVADLIAWVQAQAQSDLGLAVARRPSDSGTDRTLTIEPWERRSVGETIETLAETLGGFEMRIASTWVAGQPTNTLELWAPRYGTATGKVWWHGAQILVSSRERTAVANRVDTLGAGNDTSKLIESATSTPARLRHDLVVSYTDIDNASILDDLAAGELAALPAQADVLRATVLDDPDGLSVGDTVDVVADDGTLQIDGTYRVMGRTRRVDQDRAVVDEVDLLLGEPTGRAAVLRRHALGRYLRHLARRTNRLEGR